MSNLHSDPPLADRFTNEYGAFGNLFKEAALVKKGPLSARLEDNRHKLRWLYEDSTY